MQILEQLFVMMGKKFVSIQAYTILLYRVNQNKSPNDQFLLFVCVCKQIYQYSHCYLNLLPEGAVKGNHCYH